MKLLITGGGTGGHVNPGIAIAKYVQSRRSDAEVRFAGTAAGIESKLVPREGYRLYTVDVRGLKRSFSPSAIMYNIATLEKSLTATAKAKKILKEYRPDVVVGCGGYASFPMVHAAQQLHIPTVLLEVNAFPGVVTKSCAKKADRVLISFENTRGLLEDRPNIHLTGAPIRGDIIFADRQKAREKLGLGEKEKLVVSFWGMRCAAARSPASTACTSSARWRKSSCATGRTAGRSSPGARCGRRNSPCRRSRGFTTWKTCFSEGNERWTRLKSLRQSEAPKRRRR